MATVFHTDKGKKSVTDTGKRVVYKDSDGNIHVRYAWSDYSAVDQGEMDVPIGKPFIVLDQSDIPTDTSFADAWDVDLSSPDGVGKGYDTWVQEQVAKADANYNPDIPET
tara:strand:- start:40 stop:369 length:330 start_codon:yes stop_codon:yes gene_type:complete